jgi:hypothetical protein
LRSVSFFDGAGAARPLVVLSCWLVAGLLICGLGALRTRGRTVHARHEASAVAA